ncbi:MAG: hypothetical protein DMD91_08345 [Candidatus Rokuibacteriota bacterium]|nr:MAG: hypothetical protein DMD91_08345 [Candidatus Rokubacteria bacterium]
MSWLSNDPMCPICDALISSSDVVVLDEGELIHAACADPKRASASPESPVSRTTKSSRRGPRRKRRAGKSRRER